MSLKNASKLSACVVAIALYHIPCLVCSIYGNHEDHCFLCPCCWRRCLQPPARWTHLHRCVQRRPRRLRRHGRHPQPRCLRARGSPQVHLRRSLLRGVPQVAPGLSLLSRGGGLLKMMFARSNIFINTTLKQPKASVSRV